MPKIAPPEARCSVFTYREGLLSSFGHDLELAVTRFEITVDPDARTASATLDAGSLRVVRALRDGAELPGALSASDVASIEQSTRTDVLAADRHPEIHFRSTSAEGGADRWTVAGVLTLHGTERPITVALHREGDRWLADVPLHTPDWGVRPYSAMLGALKVKADVMVRLDLPHPAGV